MVCLHTCNFLRFTYKLVGCFSSVKSVFEVLHKNCQCNLFSFKHVETNLWVKVSKTYVHIKRQFNVIQYTSFVFDTIEKPLLFCNNKIHTYIVLFLLLFRLRVI